MGTSIRTAVKATRLRIGIQQQDLAEAIGVSRQTKLVLSRERGEGFGRGGIQHGRGTVKK